MTNDELIIEDLTSENLTREILDSARNLTILKQDLGMLPKPRENWNTIEPVEGGYYEADSIIYQYTNGKLVEVNDEENEESR